MSKTNFTKVEEALIRGMDQQAIEQLLALTGKTQENAIAPELRLLLSHLQHDLRWLLKQDKDTPERLATDKDVILRTIGFKPEELTPEDWQNARELQVRCTALKLEIEKN